MDLSKWASVFDSHPKVDTIYIAKDMPFLAHGQAASFANREKVDVQVVTRAQVYPPVVELAAPPEGDDTGGNPDDTGETGDAGSRPDDTGEAPGVDVANGHTASAKPAKK